MKKKLKKRILSDVRDELLNLLIKTLFGRNQSLERGLLDSNVALKLATITPSIKGLG